MNNSNRKLLVLLAAILISSSVLAGKNVDERLSVNPDGKVRVSIIRGDVEIEGWDQDEVHVSGELDDSTKKFIFETDGDETEIKVELDDGFFNKRWSSDDTELTIRVPKQSTLIAGGVSADFKVDGIEGGVELNSVSGDISLSNSSDNIGMESVSGDISVTNSWGKMKISTVSGDIDTDGKASFFDAQSVSGDIEATIGKSEILELTSVSGDIDINFELMEDGRVDAETVSGDITLEFDNDEVHARFDIDTGPGGDIRNSITADKPDSSFIGAEEIRFKSGKGTGRVEITTMSGTIKLEH